MEAQIGSIKPMKIKSSCCHEWEAIKNLEIAEKNVSWKNFEIYELNLKIKTYPTKKYKRIVHKASKKTIQVFLA